MKYIRTKDGIYEPIHYEDQLIEAEYYLDHENNLIDERDIIKQADTIEELCDEFVKKSKQTWNNYFVIGEDALRIFDRKYHKEDLVHYDYYGAIWTDKGLIYVAKMNEKRELELL